MRLILDIDEYLCIISSFNKKRAYLGANEVRHKKGEQKMKTMKKLWILMAAMAAPCCCA